jgi:tRNA threonylcarbamoyladenosine modification (KEOPS) complex  Pcc1 subunit
MINTIIEVDGDAEEIYSAVSPELDRHLRSNMSIEKGKKLVFKISAQDITAFRATLNSVIQMLTVFYKAKEIK